MGNGEDYKRAFGIMPLFLTFKVWNQILIIYHEIMWHGSMKYNATSYHFPEFHLILSDPFYHRYENFHFKLCKSMLCLLVSSFLPIVTSSSFLFYSFLFLFHYICSVDWSHIIEYNIISYNLILSNMISCYLILLNIISCYLI